jgi:hypothetical protein
MVLLFPAGSGAARYGRQISNPSPYGDQQTAMALVKLAPNSLSRKTFAAWTPGNILR